MAKQKAGKARRTAKRESAADRIDKDLAAAALAKRKAGKNPSRTEAAALRRVEKQREEDLRWEYYESIPQKHWRQMAQRGGQVLKVQHERYGFPIVGRFINLPEFVRFFHDFLAKNARRLAKDETDEEMLAGVSSPALERYRTVRAKQEELKFEEQKENLIRREDVHAGLARIAGALRSAGDSIQRQFGHEAYTIIEDAITEAEREGRELFGDPAQET